MTAIEVPDPKVKMIAGFGVHPAAALFPLIEGAAFDELVRDIEEHGQAEQIVVDQHGRIIDGRNRALACDRLGINVRFTVRTDPDVLQFVVSHNLHRRHLTDSQRAMIAARLTVDRPASRQKEVPDTVYFPPTTAAVSEMLSVVPNTIGVARRIVREGTESLQALASDGAVPIATAARVATEMSANEQDEYVAKVKAGADPIRTAPPDVEQQQRKVKPADRPPAPPRFGGNRRKHLAQIEALINALDGASAAFAEVDSLDKSVNAEEATHLTSDLSRQIRSLNRINQLIKERTNS